MTSLAEATAFNSSFSKQSPGLQLAIDSHSLGEFKQCPRRYYYSVVCGWQPRELSVHLVFGLLMHSARERYDHQKARGASHEDALAVVVAHALSETWNKSLKRPWQSEHPNKNRTSLLRTIIWYLDRWGDNDPIETIVLENGKPAVELSFRFSTNYQTMYGETWEVCGHIDRLGKLSGAPYVIDLKTTEWTIDQSWFAKFTPFNQFTTYVTAGQIVWKENVRGLIVDGIQVGAGFSRFERGLVPRPQEVIDEWYGSLGFWLRQMEESAGEGANREAHELDPSGAWPQNEMSCSNYARADGSRGGCEFRPVCSRAPKSRESVLSSEFKRRVWDPLQRRGDI